MVEIVIERIRAKQMLTKIMYDVISQYTYVSKLKEILVAGKDEYLESPFTSDEELGLIEKDCYRIEYMKSLECGVFDSYLVFDVVERYIENERIYEVLRLNDISYLDGIEENEDLATVNWEDVISNNKFRLNKPCKLTRHYEPSYFIALNKDSYIDELRGLILDYKNDMSDRFGPFNNLQSEPDISRFRKEYGNKTLTCYTMMHNEPDYHIHAFFELKELKVSGADDKIYLEMNYLHPPYSSKINVKDPYSVAEECYPEGYDSIESYLYAKNKEKSASENS